MKKTLATFLLAAVSHMAMAQLGLSVTVQCDEPGTLFVKIQEQIEELGELSDVTELTIIGKLNVDDQNVIRNQLPNLFKADFSQVDAECVQYASLRGHRRLKSAVLPATATELADNMLYNCDSLTDVTMPPGLTVIPYGFAEGCKQLAEITIPETVTTIKNRAFSSCYALTQITIPAGVTEIGYGAFYYCEGLKNINILGTEVTIDGEAFQNTAVETFAWQKGWTIVGGYIFKNCSQLKSFTFDDGVDLSKASQMFYNCTNLSNVRLPQDATVIPSSFFAGTAITSSIELPSTITTIGDNAFDSTKELKKINLPSSLTEVGNHLFWASAIEELDWPEQLHIIPYETFRGCKQLKRITIPATVDSLGSGVFVDCTALESIHLPEGIRTLEGTFSGCTSLKEVNIPSTVTRIDRSMVGCFSKCIFTHIDLPEGLTYVGWYCFDEVPLEDLTLPSTLKHLADGAFYSRKATYREVVVPEGVLSIGSQAFYSDSLKVVDLPSTLEATGGSLAGNNQNYAPEKIIIRAAVPPYWSDSPGGAWYAKDRNCTLYVPSQSVSLYKADEGYGVFDAIEGISQPSTLLTVTGHLTVTPDNTLGQAKYDITLKDINSNMGYAVYYSSNRPYVLVQDGATLNIGTLSLNFDNELWWSNRPTTYDVFLNYGNVSIDDVDLRFRFTDRDFFTPAIDVKVSDIQHETAGIPISFFRYDGAARATGNYNGSWVTVGKDETLHPGTGYAVAMEPVPVPVISSSGYLYWNSSWGYAHMHLQQGGLNHFLTTGDITVPLQHFAGEFPHNRNWNLVGMPYPAFFDIRGIDYDGPVRVRGKWFSPLDDEMVLLPMDAMFVQCPDSVSSITFSADRRQQNNKFVKGNTTNSRMNMRRADKNSHRTVYNLTLTTETPDNPESPDHPVATAKTRFVINPVATTGYEIGRDAPTVNDEDEALMLYTIGNGMAYAINERPLADGVMPLGVQTAQGGTYTISLSIKDDAPSETVWLVDNETGCRTALTDEPYTFTAETAVKSNNRFVIAIGNADPNSVESLDASQQLTTPFFDLLGRRVDATARGIYIKDGRKVIK